MLKRIATIFADAAAHGAGVVVGVRGGNDAYNWVKYGGAKRTVKKIAGSMADAANSMADATNELLLKKEEPALRSVPPGSSVDDEEAEAEAAVVRPLQRRTSEAEQVQVDCERCGRPSAVQLRSGDIIVTCAKCKARFWVDTDDLARRRDEE
jgi:hypothetical protein